MYLFRILCFFQLSLWTFSAYSGDVEDKVEKIIDHQKNLFSCLLPTSNYENYDGLLDYLHNNFSLRMKQFDEELVFAIFAPSSVRTKILRKGLKNQYQTGSSRGYLNNKTRVNYP